jgi:hypothetical protein
MDYGVASLGTNCGRQVVMLSEERRISGRLLSALAVAIRLTIQRIKAVFLYAFSPVQMPYARQPFQHFVDIG